MNDREPPLPASIEVVADPKAPGWTVLRIQLFPKERVSKVTLVNAAIVAVPVALFQLRYASWWEAVITLLLLVFVGKWLQEWFLKRAVIEIRTSAEEVMLSKVRYRYGDGLRFRAEPTKETGIGRYRLVVHRADTGAEETAVPGLLREHAEYLAARLDAEAARARSTAGTSAA